mmetsp:Transcript_13020/g.40093  ORF Transcript_13020/g.40093 Transcript_13020/m.40093 type:complete len:198 (-) Transcript_13020:4011-4604(-)
MIGWAAGLTARAEPRTPSLEKAVSRRALLLSAVTAVVPQVVVAAVPTIDDYYGTEGGAKKKVPGYVLPSRGERRGATSGEDKEASGGLISALDESQETVEELRRLVKALSWDDVRSVLGKKLAFFNDFKRRKVGPIFNAGFRVECEKGDRDLQRRGNHHKTSQRLRLQQSCHILQQYRQTTGIRAGRLYERRPRRTS